MENEHRMLELLEEIEMSNRKQCRYARAQFILTVIAAISCIALLVTLLVVLPQLQEIVTQAQTVLTNLETVTSELAEVDLTGMVEDINILVHHVNQLVDTSETNLTEAMENINNIDFDALNSAIKDLASVIEPIAKFFKTFKF